ncbi:hypothetical protein K438DRAFT_1978659 [Mycena galopus ATCC 62051]|nr:hypothetical protein K438DRAFT_1978659 [Mycena galopus ATCC 62051]
MPATVPNTGHGRKEKNDSAMEIDEESGGAKGAGVKKRTGSSAGGVHRSKLPDFRKIQGSDTGSAGGKAVAQQNDGALYESALDSEDGRSTNDEEEGEMKSCTICQRYVGHLQESRRANDQALEAGLKLRDILVVNQHEEANTAYVRGGLEMTQAMLTAAREEVRELYTKMRELQAEVAVAKDEAARERRSADDYADRLAECRDELSDVKDELQGEISCNERADEYRSRKRAAGGATSSDMSSSREESLPRGPRAMVQAERAPPAIVEDVPMTDAAVQKPMAPVKCTWDNVPTLTQHIITDPAFGMFTQPLPMGTWKFNRDLEFTNVSDFNAAHKWIHTTQCWGVVMAVFRTYYDGQATAHNRRHVTDVQAHAINVFRMPRWFWAVLSVHCVRGKAIEVNFTFWRKVDQPQPGAPIRAIAAYIQQRGIAPAGCLFLDEFHTLNARLVRGFILWDAIGLECPLDSRSPAAKELMHAVAVTTALLNIMAFPGQYRRLIRSEMLMIVETPRLQRWACEEEGPSTEVETAKRLAAMGITTAQVDDLYPYSRQYPAELVENIRPGWDHEDVTRLLQGSEQAANEDGGIPPVLISNDSEVIPRAPLVPWPQPRFNLIHEKGALMDDLPCGGYEDEKVRRVSVPRLETGMVSVTARTDRRGGFRGGFREDQHRAHGGYGRGFGRGRGGAPAGLSASIHAPTPPHGRGDTFSQTITTPSSTLFGHGPTHAYINPTSASVEQATPSTWGSAPGQPSAHYGPFHYQPPSHSGVHLAPTNTSTMSHPASAFSNIGSTSHAPSSHSIPHIASTNAPIMPHPASVFPNLNNMIHAPTSAHTPIYANTAPAASTHDAFAYAPLTDDQLMHGFGHFGAHAPYP